MANELEAKNSGKTLEVVVSGKLDKDDLCQRCNG
jgi:hypothetical protein